MIMKTCAYCGREEADDRIHCGGCGTELPEQPAESPKAAPVRERSWLKTVLFYLATSTMALLVYLLSLGPVLHYFGQTTVTQAGTSLMRTTQHPRWVSIVYGPALLLLRTSYSDPYYRYLEWWEDGPKR